jgi:hypothetical protein
VTSFPTASTVPAKSPPIRRDFGLRTPSISGRAAHGLPISSYQSARLTDAARTRTTTPSSSSSGVSTSSTVRTSGDPYLSRTTAFIVVARSVAVVVIAFSLRTA